MNQRLVVHFLAAPLAREAAAPFEVAAAWVDASGLAGAALAGIAVLPGAGALAGVGALGAAVEAFGWAADDDAGAFAAEGAALICGLVAGAGVDLAAAARPISLPGQPFRLERARQPARAWQAGAGLADVADLADGADFPFGFVLRMRNPAADSPTCGDHLCRDRRFALFGILSFSLIVQNTRRHALDFRTLDVSGCVIALTGELDDVFLWLSFLGHAAVSRCGRPNLR